MYVNKSSWRHAGARVQSVTGPLPGKPGQVQVAGGQVVSASQAVVVATEGPAARALLGNAMSALDSKTEEAVGTANLYFRSEPCFRDWSFQARLRTSAASPCHQTAFPAALPA